MRHKMHARKLGRTTSERKSLFKNMANALFTHEQIVSTLPKAKELKAYADKIITLAKKGTLAHRRKAIGLLQDESVVSKLFSTLGGRYKDRNGGYTRVLKYGFRKGDMAAMAVIELVDRDESAKGLVDRERIAKAPKEA